MDRDELRDFTTLSMDKIQRNQRRFKRHYSTRFPFFLFRELLPLVWVPLWRSVARIEIPVSRPGNMDHIFNFPAVRFANDFEPDPFGAADTRFVLHKQATVLCSNFHVPSMLVTCLTQNQGLDVAFCEHLQKSAKGWQLSEMWGKGTPNQHRIHSFFFRMEDVCCMLGKGSTVSCFEVFKFVGDGFKKEKVTLLGGSFQLVSG